jgi:hypothetical protein
MGEEALHLGFIRGARTDSCWSRIAATRAHGLEETGGGWSTARSVFKSQPAVALAVSIM